jgi:hypothetical protein
MDKYLTVPGIIHKSKKVISKIYKNNIINSEYKIRNYCSMFSFPA